MGEDERRCKMTKEEIKFIGKTIKKAKVDGHGMILVFTDGSMFTYDASDGGYSLYGWAKGKKSEAKE